MYDPEEMIERASDNIVAKLFRKLSGAVAVEPVEEAADPEEVEQVKEDEEPGEEVVATEDETEDEPVEGEQLPGAHTADDEVLQPVVLAPAPAPAPAQPDPEKEQLRRQVETLRAEKRGAEATRFADALVTDGKLMPHAHSAILALYTRLQMDDEVAPTSVTFQDSAGKQVAGGRAAVLAAALDGLPAHKLTQETPLHELPAGAALLTTVGKTVEEDSAELGRKQGKRFVEEIFPQQKGK